MKKSRYYDERQLLAQGKSFRWAFYAAVLLFTLYYLVEDCGGISIDGRTKLFCGIWVPVTVCLTGQIWQNAYDYVGSDLGKKALTLYGIAGVFLCAMTIVNCFLGGQWFYFAGTITEHTGRMFMGLCMVFVCVIYWTKRNLDQKEKDEEDEL